MNITNAVADFGRSMGVELSLDPSGMVALELEEGDVLTLEAADDDLLVYRVVPAPYVSSQLLVNALKACNARLQEGLGWQLQVGLHGSGAESAVVFLFRLIGSKISAHSIEQAIDKIESFRRNWSA